MKLLTSISPLLLLALGAPWIPVGDGSSLWASIRKSALGQDDAAETVDLREARAAFPDGYQQEIFHAVLQGLYRDGVANDVADRVLSLDEDTGFPHYVVYGCPLCMPAYDAFAVYRARPEFHASKSHTDTWGGGLDEGTRGRILGQNEHAIRGAIQDLIERWITERIEDRRLNGAERERWRVAMGSLREKGEAMLRAYQKSGNSPAYANMKGCPVCDGANGACEVR